MSAKLTDLIESVHQMAIDASDAHGVQDRTTVLEVLRVLQMVKLTMDDRTISSEWARTVLRREVGLSDEPGVFQA